MAKVATATGLALSLASIKDLRGWEPVDALAERVVASLHGVEGLGEQDLERLRVWPARWRALRVEVQRFYRAALEDMPKLTSSQRAAVHLGLRALLDGVVVEGWVRGQLSVLHRELLASEAGLDLCARARRTR